MECKKVVYISGPITGVKNYWEAFEQAAEDLESLGYIALNPARLPEGMTNSQYMRICFAMIDSADAVITLEGWIRSAGASLEVNYCQYVKKPLVAYKCHDTFGCGANPRSVTQAWLKNDLEEVLK